MLNQVITEWDQTNGTVIRHQYHQINNDLGDSKKHNMLKTAKNKDKKSFRFNSDKGKSQQNNKNSNLNFVTLNII
jgi:hypothetical protein